MTAKLGERPLQHNLFVSQAYAFLTVFFGSSAYVFTRVALEHYSFSSLALCDALLLRYVSKDSLFRRIVVTSLFCLRSSRICSAHKKIFCVTNVAIAGLLRTTKRPYQHVAWPMHPMFLRATYREISPPWGIPHHRV